MDEKNVRRIEGLNGVQPPQISVVAVGISGSKNSKSVLKWALDKFVPEGCVYFKLLHIRSVISRVPTPMRENVVAAFRQDEEWKVTEKLFPYKKMCSQRNVEVEVVQIESNDVVTAISGVIHKHKINKLVIGTSSRGIFSRSRTLSSKISESCPTFCDIYVVSKGKISSLRPSDSETNQSFRDDSSDTSCSTENSSSHTMSSITDSTEGSFSNFHSDSLPMQRFQALSSINQTLHKRTHSSGLVYLNNLSLDAERRNGTNIRRASLDVNEMTIQPSSFRGLVTDNSSTDQLASTSETSANDQANINFELEKLRIELRHVRGMYALAQGEAIDTSRKLNELHKRHLEEEINLKQISLKEEEAKDLATQEKQRYEAAKQEAEHLKESAEREAVERKEAEMRMSSETREKQNLESVLNGSFNQYRLFTWEEIVSATSSFSDDLKIGTGAYGTVYKCTFQHTTAALKILHVNQDIITKQFQQELDILNQIRHPHLLILLGACPERNCLVYEFMENGSLEDRLNRKNNTPPLSWLDRVRIAKEVASALVFLHNSKPEAIIHRDLKPANILLDCNNVSKIGDVGLSTVINTDSSLSSLYKDTSPVGTLCYIDPEYQRTGVVNPKSDVYAFGIVVLQLLTGKSAVGLAHKVEIAMENDCLSRVLDLEAGWPIEEAKDLAVIALKCSELRGKDRPCLEDVVIPALEELNDSAEKAWKSALVSATPPPKHFTCPILNEVMNDPCVAADGYTYDRKAIEVWLKGKDTSPMTHLPLPHKYLIPNYALLSAIMEWKSGKHA